MSELDTSGYGSTGTDQYDSVLIFLTLNDNICRIRFSDSSFSRMSEPIIFISRLGFIFRFYVFLASADCIQNESEDYFIRPELSIRVCLGAYNFGALSR